MEGAHIDLDEVNHQLDFKKRPERRVIGRSNHLTGLLDQMN